MKIKFNQAQIIRKNLKILITILFWFAFSSTKIGGETESDTHFYQKWTVSVAETNLCLDTYFPNFNNWQDFDTQKMNLWCKWVSNSVSPPIFVLENANRKISMIKIFNFFLTYLCLIKFSLKNLPILRLSPLEFRWFLNFFKMVRNKLLGLK